jgi:hypothetical protein
MWLSADARTGLQSVAAPTGTHGAAILSAAGAMISASVLLAGALLAQRHLLRVTATVDASCHPLLDGLPLHVRPSIRSTGLVRVHLVRDDPQLRAVVAVAEHRLSSSTDLSSDLIVGQLARTSCSTPGRRSATACTSSCPGKWLPPWVGAGTSRSGSRNNGRGAETGYMWRRP